MEEHKGKLSDHASDKPNGADRYGAIPTDKNTSIGIYPQAHPKTKGVYGSLCSVSSQWMRENPDLGDGGFRAFVLAFMDGFVTTLCFVLTVGSATEKVVLFAGFVSAFAGIFSMAIGEWISMQLQNDGLELELNNMSKFQKRYPERAVDHLKHALYEKYRLSEKTVESILHDLKGSDDFETNLIDFWSRTDLGIDPDELGGKPWKAVIMCAIGYGAGALVPLGSWYLGALWGEGFKGCVALSFVMTCVVGAALSNFTSYHWAYTIFRQVLVTFIAAGAVFVISIFTPEGI